MNIAENLVAGFNLHYLPFNLVRALVKTYTFQPNNATRVGLNHTTIKLAYRNYKVKGVKGVRRIDWRAFIDKISIVRQLKPYDREALIQSVEAQLTKNPRDLTSINKMVAQQIEQLSSTPVPNLK